MWDAFNPYEGLVRPIRLTSTEGLSSTPRACRTLRTIRTVQLRVDSSLTIYTTVTRSQKLQMEAYPVDVGIRAIEIYFPSQVRRHDQSRLSREGSLYLSMWNKRTLKNTMPSAPVSIPLGSDRLECHSVMTEKVQPALIYAQNSRSQQLTAARYQFHRLDDFDFPHP